jgi:hypothetical protein
VAESQLRQRPGDQQLPVPNDGPSMHDLVIADLGGWPESMSARNAIRDLLAARKRLGLERYGSILQSHNGRDAKRDLSEELADAAVYARQLQEERGRRTRRGRGVRGVRARPVGAVLGREDPQRGRGREWRP